MATDVIVAAAGTKFQIREVQRGIGGATLGDDLVLGRGRFATEIALTGATSQQKKPISSVS
jgi:hypothetical protein